MSFGRTIYATIWYERDMWNYAVNTCYKKKRGKKQLVITCGHFYYRHLKLSWTVIFKHWKRITTQTADVRKDSR